MIKISGTLHPLPFKHLEPGRFEGLVYELAKGWEDRTWQALDFIGGPGDGGVDLCGIEVADDERREWLISCKRHQRIIPSQVPGIVAETLRDGEPPPYAYVLAAACNLSRASIDLVRAQAAKRGVVEAYLWPAQELEHRLLRPENDHLLRTYFSFSLKSAGRAMQVAALKALVDELRSNVKHTVSLNLGRAWRPIRHVALDAATPALDLVSPDVRGLVGDAATKIDTYNTYTAMIDARGWLSPTRRGFDLYVNGLIAEATEAMTRAADAIEQALAAADSGRA